MDSKDPRKAEEKIRIQNSYIGSGKKTFECYLIYKMLTYLLTHCGLMLATGLDPAL